MVASKIVSGFNWADEVEREEEEEKERDFRHSRRRRSRSRSPEKPNPFGSARPREVVLQEKGIDWRKLDSSTPRKEKHLPESVPASTGSSGGKRRRSPRSRDLELNVENTRRGWARESGISSSSLTFPDQNVDSLVPPLRYPPRNIAILMKEKQWSDNSYKSDVSLSTPKEFHVEKQRESVIPKSEVQLDSRRLEPSFQDPHPNRYSALQDRDNEWNMENPRTENRDNFTVKEFGHRTQGDMRREKTPLIHREKEWRKVNYQPSDRHFVDERFPVEEIRGTHNESWDDGRYEYGSASGARERLRRSPSIDELSNREGLRYHPYNKEAGFRGNYRNVGARPLEERGNGNMDHFSGRQRFDTKEYEGPHTGRMDRGRDENHRDMDMDKAVFRRNDRKSIGGNYNNVGIRPLDENHRDMDKAGFRRNDQNNIGGNYSNVGVRPFDENHRDMDMDKAGIRRNRRNSIGGNYANVGERPLDETHRDMDMDKAGFRRNDRNNIEGNYNNVGVRPLDVRRPEKPEHLYGRQRFDAKEFDGSRTRSMDRGRAEYHPDRDTNRGGFGSNYKKRGIESRPNTSHDFQRRRR